MITLLRPSVPRKNKIDGSSGKFVKNMGKVVDKTSGPKNIRRKRIHGFMGKQHRVRTLLTQDRG